MLALIVGIVEFTVTQRQQGESATQAEYIAATEQLSETGTTRPLAGIAALAQLAQHSPERTWLMTESLSAFVRYTAPRPEEDQQSLSERVPVTLAPYADPPCGKATTPNTIPGAMASSEDLYYNYGTCTRSRPLLQANLSAQAALTSIATRNRDNETESNAPPRFKGMIASTRRNLASESRPRALRFWRPLFNGIANRSNGHPDLIGNSFRTIKKLCSPVIPRSSDDLG